MGIGYGIKGLPPEQQFGAMAEVVAALDLLVRHAVTSGPTVETFTVNGVTVNVGVEARQNKTGKGKKGKTIAVWARDSHGSVLNDATASELANIQRAGLTCFFDRERQCWVLIESPKSCH